MQAQIARGEYPVEGGQHDHTDGTPGDNNRGDKGVVGFWKEHQMTIFDVRFTDITSKSYRDGTTTSNLQRGGNLKKRKHLKACLEARLSFTLLVFSAKGCMGKEKNSAVRQLTTLLSKKCDREYAAVCGNGRARLSLSLMRSFLHLLRGEREKKGGGVEPNRTPAVDGTEMQQMDLGLEEYITRGKDNKSEEWKASGITGKTENIQEYNGGKGGVLERGVFI